MKQTIPALLFSFFILGLTCLSAQEKYKSAVYEHKAEGVKWVYGPDFGLFALGNERDSLLTGFDFEQPAPFSEGAAVVKKGALYYFLDTGGKLISKGSPFLLPCIYNTYFNGNTVYARNGHPLFYLNNCNALFSEQMIHTLTSNNYTVTSRYRGASIEKNDSLFIFNLKDSIQGIIHQNGTIILPPRYESIHIVKNKYFILYNEKMFGLTDITGAILLPPVYDYIEYPSKGIGFFKPNISIQLNSLNGSYNLHLRKGVDCKYTSISNFVNGKAWASRNGMYYIIDSIGNEIVIAEEKACTILADSLMVLEQNGIKIILNLENKTIAPEGATFLKKEGAVLLFKKGDGSTLFFNPEGKALFDQTYIEAMRKVGYYNYRCGSSYRDVSITTDYEYPESKDSIIVWKNKMVGLINKNGKTILNPAFQKIVYIGDGFFAIYDKGKMGIADTSGRIIHGPSLDTFIYLEHKIFLIKESGKWGAKDKGGNKLAETFYDNVKLHEDGTLLVKENGEYGYYCIAPIDLEVIEPPMVVVKDEIYKAFNKYPPSKHGDRDQYYEGIARVMFGTMHNHKYGFINEADSLVIPMIHDYVGLFQNGIAVVSKNYKLGIIDKKGNFVLPPEYDGMYPFQKELSVIRKDNKYGVINQKGNFILLIRYDEIKMSEDGLLVVKKDNEYGIADQKGNFVLPIMCSYIRIFENGLILVTKDGKDGIINKSGEWVVPLEYDDIDILENDLIIVEKDSKHGIINKKGNLVVPLKYDDMWVCRNDLIIVEKDSKYGIINKLGNFIVPLKYDEIHLERTEYNLIIANKDSKCGIIDLSGNLVVDVVYDRINQLRNGLILVHKDNKYGIIDTIGNFILPLEYDTIKQFEHGLNIFKENGRYGYYNKYGSFTVPPEYSGINSFENELIIVNKDSKYGIMDKTGHFVVPLEHDSINPFQTGLVIVNKDRKYGLIDKIGNFVLPVEYDLIKKFQNGLAFVKKGGKWGLINHDYKVSLPCMYDEIRTDYYPILGFDLVRNNGKFGLANSNGTILIPCDYDKIEVDQLLKDKFAYIHLDKRIGLMDRKGHIICTPKYDAFKGIGNRYIMVQKDKFWGIMDASGKELIPTSYQKCYFDDYGKFFMVKQNNLYGIIDTNFQMVVQPQFDSISNTLITSKKGQGMGLLDRHFQVHIPCKYQFIEHLEQDKFLIYHKGHSGFVDISNAILIPPTHFDEINRQADFETGYYFVKKGTKWGCVDKKGTIKVIPRFDAISCFKNGMAHVIIEPAQPIFLSFWGIKGETTHYPPSHAQPYPRDYLINTSGELLPIVVR